ncbi:hypothetical protein GCM10023213_07780 [Prosthecobacter algae]|uniref:ABC-three component systems C-terminal domain-containing protein n=1 Tax=Prosthecobacter algae TaxID=1144682 RepID=A0ABP9NVS7_9BACT
MDLKQAYYELRFENAFRSTKGDAFQTFFEKLMGLVYKADFMACRPWGNQGDRKNDGFLKSERRLFQVYAPNEMEAAKAIDKITEDFAGAMVHWGHDFDKWVFAHNAVDGLPPHVQALILKLEKDNSGIKLEPWGLEEFRLIFRKISEDDLAAWFGPVPSEQTKLELGFGDLQIVLERVADHPVVPNQQVKDVPMRKIEANALSESVATLLKAGMAKAPLVADFFNRWHDETFGERVAVAFRNKYQELRGKSGPDQIFSDLESWAGGAERGTPKHQLAVLAVLAYYFDSCDIFEEPRGVTP